MAESHFHETVLLDEAVRALVDSEGLYLDATFGRGGHSRAILDCLPETGKLIGVDKDPVAVSLGQQIEQQDSRFHMIHGSFAQIGEFVKPFDMPLKGVLADLGVSSPQLDNADRGFSFLKDGPLDMRMDTTSGLSAADWIAAAPAKDIAKVLKDYGEERFAKRIAGAIVSARESAPIETTAQLAKIVSDANPAWEKHKHPATRSFQAIRIHINDELEDLRKMLSSASDALSVGGKLVVISFHSLEDRIVKRFMRGLAKGEDLPPGIPVTHEQLKQEFSFKSKPIKPSEAEVDRNPRARSAIMRVLERVSSFEEAVDG